MYCGQTPFSTSSQKEVAGFCLCFCIGAKLAQCQGDGFRLEFANQGHLLLTIVLTDSLGRNLQHQPVTDSLPDGGDRFAVTAGVENVTALIVPHMQVEYGDSGIGQVARTGRNLFCCQRYLGMVRLVQAGSVRSGNDDQGLTPAVRHRMLSPGHSSDSRQTEACNPPPGPWVAR